MSIRVGILGAGYIGGVHAQRLATLEGVEVAAVCDQNREAAAKLAASLPKPPEIVDSAGDLIGRCGIGALYVCLPPFAHGDEVEQAAARGIHVFLEKPIALEREKALRMVEAVEAAGVVSQVGFQMRFRRGVRELKRLLDSGEAGRPTLFTGRYWTNMEGHPWWRDRAKSGGQILEQVIHIYDLAAHLMGEADLERTAGRLANVCHGGREDYRMEDTSVGVHNLRNGAVSVVTGSNCALPGHFLADFRVVCERAFLEYRCTGQPWVAPDESTLWVNGVKQGEWRETEDVQLLESVDFLEAIRHGRKAMAPIRDGLRAMDWIEAVRRADSRV